MTMSKQRRLSVLFMMTVLTIALTVITVLCGGVDRAAAASGNDSVMIQAGHADFGPTYANGQWKLKIRDDSGDEPVWRDPENVVFRLGSSAMVPMPNDAQYSFIGERPGTKLYVIPQTQKQDVVWLGWNTQEAGVLQNLDRGANLSLDGVSGPGAFHVYLENGNNNPQPLWDSTKGFPQQSWIETNAHTHVNWVFSKPGIYHVKLTFSGKLKNGRQVSDTRVLNFAVGDSVNPQAALAGVAASSGNTSGTDQGGDSDDDQSSDKSDSSNANDGGDHNVKKRARRAHNDDTVAVIAQMVTVIVVLAMLIVCGLVLFAVMRSRKAKKQALELRRQAQMQAQIQAQAQALAQAQMQAQAQAQAPTQPMYPTNNLQNLVQRNDATTVLPPMDQPYNEGQGE